MAKKIFLRDENNIKILPITRGELILDSSGKQAFRSNEFLATDSQPGLMSPADKQKLETVAGNTVDTELSNTSTNPVQNKVLTQIINSIREKYLKSAVVSGNKVTITDQSNNTVEFVNSTYQIVTNAVDGLVPKYDAVDGTIDAQTTDWVLTNHNGTLGWYKLPTAAFSSSSVQLFVGAKSTSNNNNSNSATTNGNTYLKLFDNSTLKNQYNIKGAGLTTVISDDSGTITVNVPTSHNQASSDINSLTGYSKATAVAAITTSDSLNTALGKLELKADTAYTLVAGAYDGDGTIENLAEILKVLEGIKDTETIQAIIGKYLPLTGGTLTGTLKLDMGNSAAYGIHILKNGTVLSRLACYNYDKWVITDAAWSKEHILYHTGNLTKVSQLTNDAGYLTSIPSHTHDYIPFEQSVNGKDMNTIKTTGFYYGYTMTNSASTNISSFIVAKYSPDWGSQIQLCSSDSRAYIRYWQNAGGVMGNWKTLAYTSDIPTKLSDLTDDLGVVTGGPYLPLSGGTMNGPITFGDGAQGLIQYKTWTSTGLGTYPLMNTGTAGIGIFARASKSTDEGGIIISEDTCIIHNSADTGWNFQVHNTDLNQRDFSGDNASKTITFGITDSGSYVWSRGGFQKNGSDNNYILLGGGSHKLISDFVLSTDFASKELASNLTTITKTLTVTKDWMDTGIKYTDLTTGTYAVQVYVHSSADGIWYGTWSGIMSWYGSSTNGSRSDEILLHCAGHAVGPHIYLRTSESLNSAGTNLRLQIAASKTLTSASYTFKFKKLI